MEEDRRIDIFDFEGFVDKNMTASNGVFEFQHLPIQIYPLSMATRFLKSIEAQGLKSQSRNHVHLSADRATATNVGSRHGVPVILMIDTEQMQNDGISFYLSANGVWLTEYVAPRYFSVER